MRANEPSDFQIDFIVQHKRLSTATEAQVKVQQEIRDELRTQNLIAFYAALKQPTGPGADDEAVAALHREINHRLMPKKSSRAGTSETSTADQGLDNSAERKLSTRSA
ncbi:hypothetical protein [Kribbella sp. DT2]|uniref:hypothetical protein n=1 Tax=Kribbella sp. DT2 TaxID=3393427 RepID=UPI003CF5163D